MLFLKCCINRCTKKIQTKFREYKRRKDRKREAAENRRKLRDEVIEEIKDIKKQRQGGVLPTISRAIADISKVVENLTSFEEEEELIPKQDQPRLVNAILKFQSRSMIMSGIVDIKLTFGEEERTTEQRLNDNLRKESKPHFEILEVDISGTMEMKMFLWVKFGQGDTCICTLDVKKKPANISQTALVVRERELRKQGIRLAWNPYSHIEFHGECSIMVGKSGFAVDNIALASTVDEAEALQRRGYKLTQDLSKYNLPTSIWIHQKEPFPDDDLYHFGSLSHYEWFDKRLKRCVQVE